ncbi:MAG: mandelate racemase/muconate lactonizing enzyme family protein [Caldilineaceae bacterium]|nr:mandelate racemase/muconate lactonizing enzyme family protein [Caldilineaceae bacterium]
MIIRDVNAVWLSCPIPYEQQHVSDFGRLTSFDMTLVTITTDDGLTGYGEAKAAVGSAGGCASLAAVVKHDLRPILIGQDARRIVELWERMYNGTRDHYALSRGRGFPILGRRGLTLSAMSGVDMALWDLLGKSLGVPVVQLLGGACRDEMRAYASGGWADSEQIGSQLAGYIERGGFDAVKMRVGVMDGTVDHSVARVRAARDHLGPAIDIMVDAHGTFSVPEAKRFCRELEACNVRWFEEPTNSDNRRGTAEIRATTSIPISVGESEFTRFDFRDLIEVGAADILQPDLAICGGITEGVRIAHLASAYQLELAPHCWGSAFSFMAGVTLAFASPAAIIIEYSLGANPLLRELAEEKIPVVDGKLAAPTRPGLGVTPRAEFVREFAQDA